jgi:hypothetical protein
MVFGKLFQRLCRKRHIQGYVRDHTQIWIKLVLYFRNLQKCFLLYNCAQLGDVGQV